MESSLRSISKIFNEKIYRIPDYQRGYAWTSKQIVDFWGDVLQLDEDMNHYVGVITLESVPSHTTENWSEDKWIMDGRNYEAFYVVDGQQRLTTTVILIQAICEISLEKGIGKLNYTEIADIRKKYIFESHDGDISRSYIFGYEKDNPSYEFLKINIFNEISTSGYTKEETIYTNNLEKAKEYFRDNLSKFTKEEIESVYKKITQQLLFNTYSIESDIDVFVAFETMNNRGVRLSNLELLKNRLIYLSTKFKLAENDKSELRRNINDAWRSIYHYLGKNKLKPLRDDRFLYNHTLTYFGDVLSASGGHVLRVNGHRRYVHRRDMSDELSYLLLDNIFSTKISKDERVIAQEDINPKYIKNYVENISACVEIWFSLNNPTSSKLFNDDEKLWIDKLNRQELGFHIFAPALLYFYLLKPSKAQSVKFLGLLENFSFLLSFTSYGMTIHHRRFMQRYYKKKSTPDSVISTLEDYIEEFKTKDESLTDRIQRSRGFYEWSGIKYFLYEYELSLKEASRTKRNKIDWDTYNEESEEYVSVEHIYPRTDTNEYWERLYGFSASQKRQLRDSVGNLLPLSIPKNSSLQNKAFPVKVDNGSKVGYRYGSYSENEISSHRDWEPKDILERGIRLLEFMDKRWAVNTGDRSKKIEILRLGFLEK